MVVVSMTRKEWGRSSQQRKQNSRWEAPQGEVQEHREPPEPPIEDLFTFSDDDIDFMSAESFPASDPPPPPSDIGMSREE